MKLLRSDKNTLTKSSPNLLEYFEINKMTNDTHSNLTGFHNSDKILKKKHYVSDSNLNDDSSIPSPPLSPKINSINNNNHENLDISQFEVIHGILASKLKKIENRNIVILVRPVWEKSQTVKLYRSSSNKFLTQYQVLRESPLFSDIRKNRDNYTYSRNLRVFKNQSTANNTSESESARFKKVRYTVKGTENDTEWIPKKNVRHSPHKHFSKSIGSPVPQSSPLASSSVIGKAPQYVPNMSWEKLPDYSPPITSIPLDNIKALKVEWKGSQMNLSNDPLRNKLHPAEIVLAQILRLPSDLYLDSKRRLFLEKVYRLKKGLPFRRTDAQKACRIDVNKASRLYAAFEKVGWLEDSNFIKYLQ